MSQVSYYRESEAQDAMAVIAKWMGRHHGLKVVYHNGTAVDADIFNGVIRIPKLACSGGLDEEALMLLRGRVYHESGHIAFTNLEKSEYPSGILFEITNAIEDPRMERQVSEEHPGTEAVFRAMLKYHNQKIAERAANGQINGAIWEALVAMMLQSRCETPAWRLSDKAKRYFDAAYDKFAEWKLLKDAKQSVELAKEVYELMKDAHEEYKQEQQEQEQQEQESGESQESGEEQQEDDDSGEGNGQGSGGEESEEGEESEGSSGGSSGEEGEEEEGSEEGQPSSGTGSDFDDEEEEGEGQGGSSGSTGEEGTEEGAGDAGGESGEGESGGEETSGEETGGGKYEPSDSGETTSGEPESSERDDAALEREMEEELEGVSLEELLDEDIAKALEELDPADSEYLARRENDEHIMVEGDDRDKETFKKDRESISTTVATMTASLVQALRAKTRCRKDAYKRQGKIDNKRLVQIAKNLSKEVFYQTRQGQKLDTVVEIIIDESGSMRKYHEVRLAAIAIGEALSQVGIPFEIHGTTTRFFGSSAPPLHGLSRTNPLVYKHYKTFDQGWMSVRHNMSRTGNHKHNVDGEAVEYVARRLASRPEARKIVFSLSDGQPDAGHGNFTLMGKNLVRSCERARKAGIEVYGIGIGTTDPREYYGAENFIYVDDVEEDLASAFVGVVGMGVISV